MGKFTESLAAALSVFDSVSWTNESIKTFPVSYNAQDTGSTYIRVDVVAGNPGVNLGSVSGLMSIDVFTPAGVGPRRANEIADALDRFLVGKNIQTLNGALQFSKSTFTTRGVDRANPTLLRGVYSIPFNFFSGVS